MAISNHPLWVTGNPESFRGLTLDEQIAKCQALAQEAERFAAVCPDERDHYLHLAAEWSNLAEEMERAVSSRDAERHK